MERITLVVTNVIKLGGLLLGIHAGFSSHPSPDVLVFAGFMMAGAQLSETSILWAVRHFFGGDPRPPTEPPPARKPRARKGPVK